jgi:hypothetical protein
MTQARRFAFALFVSGFIAQFLPLALAAQSTAPEPPVSAETIAQIEAIQAEKASRNAAQQKMDSRLLQAAKEAAGQQLVPTVSLEASLVIVSDGDTLVDISITAREALDGLMKKIDSLGGAIVYPSQQYMTVRAKIPLSAAEEIAGFAEVKFIEPAVPSTTHRLTAARVNASAARNRIPFAARADVIRSLLQSTLNVMRPKPLTGSVNSQGDRTHRADDARSTYGYQGAGIRIGVLSDSYNVLGGASSDVTSGNLPGSGNPSGNTTPVTVLQDYGSGGDEGRAMLQIIHDLAPKAQLFFATANVSEASFASNITALRNAPNNCDIIIDDVGYYDEPVFQDGIVAQAVNNVTAGGGLYFSSAGNEGSVAKASGGYFEGDFNDTGSPAFNYPGGAKAGTIHNFGTAGAPINGDVIISAGPVYNLTWSDPQGGSSNDYDLFLVSSGGTVKAQSTNIQNGTQNPYEALAPATLVSGDRLIVFKRSTAAVRAFALNTNRGRLTKVTTGQTHGHSSAADAYSVAAASAAAVYPSAFSGSSQAETFTSDGPRRLFFLANGAAITPGNFLFGTSGGAVRNKPDITAADGVSTTLPGSTGLNPFYGTSAAAPHAGAIAALLKSANPSLTAAQIRTILTTTTVDVESAGYDNISGYGIVQAFQAIQAAAQPGGSCGVSTNAVPSMITAASLPPGGVLSRELRPGGETWTYHFDVAQAASTRSPAKVLPTETKPSEGTATVSRVVEPASPASGQIAGDSAAAENGEATLQPLRIGKPLQRRFVDESDYLRLQETPAGGAAGESAALRSSVAVTGDASMISYLESPLQLDKAGLTSLDVGFEELAKDHDVSSVRVFMELTHPHPEQLKVFLSNGKRSLLLWNGSDGGTTNGSSLTIDRLLTTEFEGETFSTAWSLYISDRDHSGLGVLQQAWLAATTMPRQASTEREVVAAATLDIAAVRAYLKTAPNAGTEVNTPTTGQTVYFHGDYQLTGSGSAVNVTQRALLDGSLLCSGSSSGSPGLSYTVWCLGGWAATAGSHTLQWDFDYGNTVAETNETNNSTSKSFTPTGLDIGAVRAYMRTAPNGGTEVSPPTVGQTVYLHGDYQVTGSGSAVNVTQRALLDSSLMCSGSNSGTPGLSYTAWCVGGWTATAGSHTLQWDFDYGNTVTETNESNNSVSKSFTPAGLDIAATRAYLRTAPNGGNEVDPPVVGQTVYLHGDYQVTGSGSAVSVTQRALLDGSLMCSGSNSGSPGFSYTAWCLSGWTATAGSHTLQWDFDYGNAVAETNENNNSAAKSFAPAGLDIAATRAYLRTAPNGGTEVDPPAVGQTVYLHGDYQVTGSGSAVNVTQRALLDGSLMCSGSSSASPGLNYTVWCVGGWAATAGSHTLQWDFDYGNTVGETNENNNSTSKSFTPSGGAIDIVAQRAYLRTAASGGGSEVTQPASGQAVYFHADYQVTGSGNAVTVTERALLDGNVLCACSNSATPGNSYVASCNQAWTATSGSHTLQWDFDYGNAVGETNESNNSTSKPFSVPTGDTTPPSGAITINSGALFTASTNVALGLSANDAVGVVGYYVSNSSTIPTAGQAGWTAVASTASLATTLNNWSIASGDGGKTVYAWYKDAAGNVSNTASAGITLDQTAPSNGSLTATPGDHQVQLTWSGQSDSTSGVASYKLVFATGSTPPANCGGATLATVSPFAHMGLNNQQSYSYRLCATDTAGNINIGVTGTATPTAVSHNRNDFDGDGKADVFWRNSSGISAVWFMNGGAFGSGAYTSFADPSWTVGGSGDFNGDGKTDLLWRHTSGLVAIWLMNGASIIALDYANPLDSSWTVAGVGDFNGDGKDDVLWRHSSGINAIWFMNGVAISSGVYTTFLEPIWTAAAVGDFDGDHKADILWRHPSGINAVWLMNGATRLSGTYVNTLELAWTLVATGDFDADGKTDVVWRSSWGTNAIWFMNGGAIRQGAYTTSLDPSWTLVSTGDFNGDSKADLMWRCSDSRTAIWIMNGTAFNGTYGPLLPTSWTSRPSPATNGQ